MYKTTIVIWSIDNPGNNACIDFDEDSLVRLAEDVAEGEAYCSLMETEPLSNEEIEEDPDGEGVADFFSLYESGEIK